MALPLFDDVIVSAVPLRDGPVRTQEGKSPTTAHTSARLSASPFVLDGDDRPKSHRPATIARHGSVYERAYWSAFAKGKAGQSAPGAEHDEEINRYLRDGYRLGKLVGWKPPKD